MDKHTISLPDEHAAYINQKIDSGEYASVSDVVRAGLRALQERDRAIESWLQNQVAPVYDAMVDDPARAVPAKSVFDDIRTLHSRKIIVSA